MLCKEPLSAFLRDRGFASDEGGWNENPDQHESKQEQFDVLSLCWEKKVRRVYNVVSRFEGWKYGC